MTSETLTCSVRLQYIGFPEETEQPPWQLRGFEKIQQLEPGQTTTVTFTLRRKDVSTWRTVEQRWQQAEKIQIGVGAHSRALDLVCLTLFTFRANAGVGLMKPPLISQKQTLSL